MTLYHATLCRAKVLEWVVTQTKKFQSPSLGKSFHLFSLNFFPPSLFEISVLLSNCSKQSTNNARTEYKYPAILYGYLHSWLFCKVKYLSKRLAALACIYTFLKGWLHLRVFFFQERKKVDDISLTYTSADCYSFDLLTTFNHNLKKK